MANRQNTIELNGKKYDARTGKLHSAEPVAHPAKDHKAAKPAPKRSMSPGMAVDGFAKRPSAARIPANRSTTTAHNVHSKTTKSKTLMRHTVPKPKAPVHQASAPAITKKPHSLVHMDPQKQERSKKFPKSSLISRFGAPLPTSATNSQTNKATEAKIAKKPPAEAPEISKHIGNLAIPQNLGMDTFQKAIDSAVSHKQKPLKKPNRRQRASKKLKISGRAVNLAAGSLAAVLLFGFVAYQNVPNLSMRLATARSGVSGSLPEYSPAGFNISGPISYQPGQIILNFKSNSDDRAFKVTQSASQLNSESLLESFVAVGKRQYQTFQSNGKTIFVYDDNNATWVDGGIWYQIEGKSALNNDQLIKLASSL